MSFSIQSSFVPFICAIFLVLPVRAQEGEAVNKSEKPQAVQPADSKTVAQNAPDAYWIGVRVAPIPSVLLPQFGVKEDGVGRVVVEQVIPNGPAAKAGLKRGDVILQLGGKDIFCLGDLVRQVDSAKAIEQPMVVAREGKNVNLTVTPAARPAQPAVGEIMVEDFPDAQVYEEIPFNYQRPRRMMRHMENAFRQMQGGVDGGKVTEDDELTESKTLPGGQSKRFDVTSHTGPDGKSKVRVTKTTVTDGKPERKTWEAASIDKLPDEVRKEVDSLFGR